MSNHAADAEDLAGFGYPQQLHRKLGSYASFAAGFSFVSILTTVFQLFFFGFSFGGAAFFWTWPIVFAGQLMVAFCFMELAAKYPISGCIYQWSRRLSTPTIGWFAGWTMLIAQIVTVSAAAIALQVVLPTLWSGFQLVGSDPSLASVGRRDQRGPARRDPDHVHHDHQRDRRAADVADQRRSASPAS